MFTRLETKILVVVAVMLLLRMYDDFAKALVSDIAEGS